LARGVPHEAHKDGYFPIHRACWGHEERHAETVAIFLKAGVSATLRGGKGETMLQMTERSGNAHTATVIRKALATAAEL